MAPRVYGAIKLRGAVISAANHCQHIASIRIECDERRLRGEAAWFVNLIEAIELALDCLGREALQVQIQGGDDWSGIIAALCGRPVRVFIAICYGLRFCTALGSVRTIHIVNEIRRERFARRIKFSDQQRFLCCNHRLIQRNGAVAHHCGENRVAPRPGGVVMAERRIARRALNHSGDGGGFVECHVL